MAYRQNIDRFGSEVTSSLDAVALAVYVQSNVTLTTSELPLNGLVEMNAVRTVNGEVADRNIAFGKNGSNLIIREPGLYSIGVFAEFTNIPSAAGFVGARFYGVGGGITRRLWMYKGFGQKDELAGNLEVLTAITAPTEIEVAAIWDGDLIQSVNLARVYAELSVNRISGLAGVGSIS